MAEDPGESKVIKQLDRTCREAGFFRAVHRVIDNAPKDRVCVAYFYETKYDAPVDHLDFCKQRTKTYGRAVYQGAFSKQSHEKLCEARNQKWC
ncbi:hypothetical protein WN943_021477 [Citrus x changshan-huyou]